MKLKIFFTNNSFAVANIPDVAGDKAADMIADRMRGQNGVVVFGNCIACVNQITNILILDDNKKQRHAKNGIIKD